MTICTSPEPEGMTIPCVSAIVWTDLTSDRKNKSSTSVVLVLQTSSFWGGGGVYACVWAK